VKQRRTLSLKRESLTELTAADLAGVVAAQGIPTLGVECGRSVRICLTDNDRTTCLNCE
jgi:hypothetical protein